MHGIVCQFGNSPLPVLGEGACAGSTEQSKAAELSFAVLTSIQQIEEVAEQWQTLYCRAGTSFFGDYGCFCLWWKHFGQNTNLRPHVVIARNASGVLRALAPMVARRRGLLWTLEWAGAEVFDYCDILAESKAEAKELWGFVLSSAEADLVVAKDMRHSSGSWSTLVSSMRLRKERASYYVKLDYCSGSEWLAAQSRKMRGDVRRKAEKMAISGPVANHVYRQGDVIPDAVIDALYEQKKAWCGGHCTQSGFLLTEMRAFLRDIARYAAQRDALYLAWTSCGDAIVACHMGFVYANTLYLYVTSYAEAFGLYSPGNYRMVETIKAAINDKRGEIDFMRGDEGYKQRFASGQRSLSDFVCGRSLVGKLLVRWL